VNITYNGRKIEFPRGLSPDYIKRICESTNPTTYSGMIYEEAELNYLYESPNYSIHLSHLSWNYNLRKMLRTNKRLLGLNS